MTCHQDCCQNKEETIRVSKPQQSKMHENLETKSLSGFHSSKWYIYFSKLNMVCIEGPRQSQWHVILGKLFRLDALCATSLRGVAHCASFDAGLIDSEQRAIRIGTNTRNFEVYSNPNKANGEKKLRRSLLLSFF